MKESKSRSKKSKKEKKSKEHRERRKDKKKRRKEEKSKEKLIKKQLAEEIKKTNLEKSAVQETTNENVVKEEDCGPPICKLQLQLLCSKIFSLKFLGLMNRGSRPETKAEYDKRQSRIQRVQDPETGRIRFDFI